MNQMKGANTPTQPGVESVIERHINAIGELTGDVLRLTRGHFNRLHGDNAVPTTGETKKVKCWDGIYGSWEERLEQSMEKLKDTIDLFQRDGSGALAEREPELEPGQVYEVDLNRGRK